MNDDSKNGEENVTITALEAANEDGAGLVTPQPGRGASPAPSNEGPAAGAAASEAARLAAAQAERLAKRAEQPPKPAEQLKAELPAPLTKTSELHVTIYSNGRAEVQGPINNPDQMVALVATALQVHIQHVVALAAANTEARVRAEAKVPFMQRMFQRKAAAKPPHTPS